jgi:deoxyribonucleoside regulator
MAYDIKIMVKVATLYYKDNLTQDNISKKLKISKYQVNRILKRALETGIVKVNISDPTISVAPLEEKLEKRFNFRRAIVVDNYGLSDIELKSKLGLLPQII